MTPTVEQVKDRAAFLLGDEKKRKFTDDSLQQAFAAAFEELYDYLLQYQIPTIELIATYTLAGSTTALTPATASISNLGELVRLEERPSGTTEDFWPVEQVDQLSQRDPDATRLREFTWRQDQFNFVGATGSVDLRITYLSSGTSPTAGTVGIDGSLNYLAARTAAIAGPPKGYVEVARDLDIEARGANRDGSGGYLHRLIQPMVRSLNKVQMQQPAYRAGGTVLNLDGVPPFYTSE